MHHGPAARLVSTKPRPLELLPLSLPHWEPVTSVTYAGNLDLPLNRATLRITNPVSQAPRQVEAVTEQVRTPARLAAEWHEGEGDGQNRRHDARVPHEERLGAAGRPCGAGRDRAGHHDDPARAADREPLCHPRRQGQRADRRQDGGDAWGRRDLWRDGIPRRAPGKRLRGGGI